MRKLLKHAHFDTLATGSQPMGRQQLQDLPILAGQIRLQIFTIFSAASNVYQKASSANSLTLSIEYLGFIQSDYFLEEKEGSESETMIL